MSEVKTKEILEDVISLSLTATSKLGGKTEKEKEFFTHCVQTGFRFEVAEIAINLHERIFGKETRWNIAEARMLRHLFARELSLSLRALENWMEIKRYIIDELPSEETRLMPYEHLYEVCQLSKSKKLTARQAMEKFRIKRKDPNGHRLELLLRYSSNLLASCRKYKMPKNSSEEVELVCERLRECLKLLELERD